MVLDIREFRENPDAVRESQRRRYADVKVVDQIIELDTQWRKARFALDQAAKELGQVKKEMGQLQKQKRTAAAPPATAPPAAAPPAASEAPAASGAGAVAVAAAAAASGDIDAKIAGLLQRKEQAEAAIARLEKEEEALKAAVTAKLSTVGNFVHESVPVSRDEAENGLVKKWGAPRAEQGLFHHHELLQMIDGADTDRGVKVAGHRAYFLKGWGVKLNMALYQFGLALLDKAHYTLVQTPFFMRREIMSMTAQLSDFDESLYKVDEGSSAESREEKDEKYLIATSEQPISGFHAREWLQPKELPLRYAGFSTCFRKEAGAHGKDTWGIFRVHQFEKVEQFVITEPDKSWAMHDEMLATAESFYQALGIPYRVVSIVSGALNNAAAKKYDVEGWFPGFAEYRELVSCSNCTDYQSRSLEVRYGQKKEGDSKKLYVHMLNSTMVATERCLCCVLENFQCKEGIRIPDCLRPFMGGAELIPFVNPPPKPEPAKK
jgi:seryl-tRNA synthetase